jgi:hypothetical protein
MGLRISGVLVHGQLVHTLRFGRSKKLAVKHGWNGIRFTAKLYVCRAGISFCCTIIKRPLDGQRRFAGLCWSTLEFHVLLI